MTETGMPPVVPKKRSAAPWVVVGLVVLGAGAWFGLGMGKGEQEPAAQEVQVATPGAASVASVAPQPEHAPPPPPPPEEPETTEPSEQQAQAAASAARPATKSACSSPCEGEANSAFKAALRSRAQLAQGCYMAALRQNEMLQGKLTVALRVAPSGRACSVAITNDSLGSATVNACIKKRFQDASYPPPRGGCVDAAVPLNMVSKQ